MAAFKDRLNKALSMRNMTAAELSRLSGIDEGTLSNYKKGKYEPKQRKVESIAIALNVEDWQLLTDEPLQKVQPEQPSIPQSPAIICPHCGKPIELEIKAKERK